MLHKCTRTCKCPVDNFSKAPSGQAMDDTMAFPKGLESSIPIPGHTDFH